MGGGGASKTERPPQKHHHHTLAASTRRTGQAQWTWSTQFTLGGSGQPRARSPGFPTFEETALTVRHKAQSMRVVLASPTFSLRGHTALGAEKAEDPRDLKKLEHRIFLSLITI